jgi:Flp pilus assembly protein, protease CpaA
MVLTICLITDIVTQKIFNVVLVPAFLFGITYNVVAAGWSGLELSLLGTLFGLGILIIPYVLGFMGAGDVKLLAVIGAIKGYVFVIYTTVFMSLTGGVIAVIILIYQRRFLRTIVRIYRGFITMLITGFKIVDFGLEPERNKFPYAMAIFTGALIAQWWMR